MSELEGMIKNALAKGWPPQEVFQSLLNSGYSPQEIQLEISKINNPVNRIVSTQSNSKNLKNYQLPENSNKKKNNFIWIISISILLLIVAIASISYFVFLK